MFSFSLFETKEYLYCMSYIGMYELTVICVFQGEAWSLPTMAGEGEWTVSMPVSLKNDCDHLHCNSYVNVGHFCLHLCFR